MEALKQHWLRSADEAILTVERYLADTDDRRKDFVLLANWICSSSINPWGFMPAGWETVKSHSAQFFAGFLHTLHHSMCDDGNLIFVEELKHGSFMIIDVTIFEADKIQALWDKRFSQFGYRRPFEVHSDVQRFIDHTEAREGRVADRDARELKRLKFLDGMSRGES